MITESFSTSQHPYIFEDEIVEIDLPADANHGRRGWIAALGIDSHAISFDENRWMQSYPKTALQRTGERRVPVWRIACDDRIIKSGTTTIYHEDGTRLCDNTPYALACEIVYKLMRPEHRCIITYASNGRSTKPLTRGDVQLEYT